MSEKNRCTVCGETLELNGLNKAVQDVVNGLGGLEGLFETHFTEENYNHNEIDEHVDNENIHFEKSGISHNDLSEKGIKLHSEIDTHLTDDVIKTALNVQGVSVGGNFTGSVGNVLHGATQRCTHNHNLANLAEKSHTNLTDKGTNTHSQIDSHLTDDVIKTALNVQGVSVGGDISGTVGEAKDKLINATLYYSVSGWALSQTVWAIWGVPLSNTTATLTASFYVNKGGNFKFVICYGNLAANSGYTMSCKFTSAYAINGGTTVNLTASADWDIPLGGYDVRLQDKCSNTLTIPDNAVVGIYFRKDDNAGGASGDVYVSGIYLERQ